MSIQLNLALAHVGEKYIKRKN